MDDQHKVPTRNSNVRKFATTKAFLHKAMRQRAHKPDLDDRLLYDRAVERQREQAASRKQNRTEPSTK